LTGDRTIPRQMRAYAAVVTVIEEGPARRYREPAGLEEPLLNRTRELGYGEVVDRFRGEGPKPQAATGAG
jgi:hypothetical protein